MSAQETQHEYIVDRDKLYLARKILKGHGFQVIVASGFLYVSEKALQDDQVQVDMRINNVTLKQSK